MTALDVPAPDLTVEEERFVSRPAVDIAADVREAEVERAARAMAPVWGHNWDRILPSLAEDYRRLARAALAAARPPAPADERKPKPCPRCGEVCKHDGWGHVHASGIGIGSCAL